MKSKSSLVPVKRILKQINLSKNSDDINNCKELIDNYIKSAKKHKVVNYHELRERLDEELFKRQEELLLVKIFND